MDRSLLLRLRISTSLTCRLGLSAHICELQLHLKQLADLVVRSAA